MKIIITGATGSLGAFLTRWFSGRGHDVIALGRTENPPVALLACSTYVRADITKPMELPDADVCIHCAGLADDKATPPLLFEANVTGTKNIVAASGRCKIFIHVSSSSVYINSDTPLLETMAGEEPGKQLSHYGKSKLLAEEVVRANARNDSCFILRPRAIYGAGDKVLLPRILKLMRNNKMISIGDMNVKLSLTHFANFAGAIERCISSAKSGMHIYNVSDDEVYVLHDVVKKLLFTLHTTQLAERKLPLWFFKMLSKFRLGDATPLFLNTVSKNLVLDISKIKQELNYSPVMNFDLSLDEINCWVTKIGGTKVLRKADPQLAWVQ
jgi:nucleoside-diphosphate-sugar epimerase